MRARTVRRQHLLSYKVSGLTLCLEGKIRFKTVRNRGDQVYS